MDKIKVELRQVNKSESDEYVNLTVELNNGFILPEAASNYNVSLLKFSSSFNTPILHIPEDKPVVYYIYLLESHAQPYKIVISGFINSIKHFCEIFNKQVPSHGTWVNGEIIISKSFLLEYNETESILSVVIDKVSNTLKFFPRLHMDGRGVDFFKNGFDVVKLKKPDLTGGTHQLQLPSEVTDGPGKGIARVPSRTDNNSAFYNFEYVQLLTNLTLNETNVSNKVGSVSVVEKLSTLGTIHTNASTQDSYYEGGLVYLPNFMITSALTSDLPLKSFFIRPIIYYKTGESMGLNLRGVKHGDNSCYALVEFSPKE